MTVQATTIGTPTQTSAVPAKQPLWGSLGAGLVASLCCGGSLVFGLVGLGAAYSALGFARYIPQALAVGTLLIVGDQLLVLPPAGDPAAGRQSCV